MTWRMNEKTLADQTMEDPLEIIWREAMEAMIREAEPHRFTFPGQVIPWMDPIRGPYEAKVGRARGGLSPSAMIARASAIEQLHGKDTARAYSAEKAILITSLGRADWNSFVTSELSRLASS